MAVSLVRQKLSKSRVPVRSFLSIVTVFTKNKTLSSLTLLIGCLLSCRHTSCTCLILCRRAGGRHCAFAVVCPVCDRKLDTRFSPQILSAVVDAPPTTDATVEQDICPCPFLCFYLCLFLSNCELASGSRSSFHVSARRAIASNSAAS